MKNLICLIVLSCMFLAVGCDVNPSKVGDEQAVEFIEKITYVQDTETGLCFAIIATRKTGSTDQSGIGITQVPCDQVEELLVNQTPKVILY